MIQSLSILTSQDSLQFLEKNGSRFWSFSSSHPSCLYVLSVLYPSPTP